MIRTGDKIQDIRNGTHGVAIQVQVTGPRTKLVRLAPNVSRTHSYWVPIESTRRIY